MFEWPGWLIHLAWAFVAALAFITGGRVARNMERERQRTMSLADFERQKAVEARRTLGGGGRK